MFDLHLSDLKKLENVQQAIADIFKIPASLIKDLESKEVAKIYFTVYQKPEGFRTSVAIYPHLENLQKKEEDLALDFAQYFDCDVLTIASQERLKDLHGCSGACPNTWLLVKPSGEMKIVHEDLSDKNN